jgi:hypothetical protein
MKVSDFVCNGKQNLRYIMISFPPFSVRVLTTFQFLQLGLKLHVRVMSGAADATLGRT